MKKLIGRLLNGLNRHMANNPANRSTQILQAVEYDRVRDKIAQKTPENIALKGYKVYSQHDEDGIIAELFKRIPNSRTFIEIGIQDGTECNSLNLLLNGWKGTWIEGDKVQVQKISSALGTTNAPNKLKVIHSFISEANILDICNSCTSFLSTKDVSFFSLDIDGNDFYILQKLLQSNFFPQAFCVEYNAKFPIPVSLKIKYDKSHVWDGTDYQAASLQAYIDLLGKYDYTLICCNLVGINAFFVKNEYLKYFKVYTAEELFQPCRYYLSPMMCGHPPSLRYLKNEIDQVRGIRAETESASNETGVHQRETIA